MAKGKVEIRIESCKSCGYCVKFCPKGVLAIGENVNQKGYQYVVAENPDDCIGCAQCGQVCPDAAIEVYREA
jgi:2-oxoglutarate ferredoxin oxidoreductase subunit delta